MIASPRGGDQGGSVGMKVFDKKWVMALGMALGLLVGSATVWGHSDPKRGAKDDLYTNTSASPNPQENDPSTLKSSGNNENLITLEIKEIRGLEDPLQALKKSESGNSLLGFLNHGFGFLREKIPDLTAFISGVFKFEPSTEELMAQFARIALDFMHGGMNFVFTGKDNRGKTDKAWFPERDGPLPY